jgi:hypothetical protein
LTPLTLDALLDFRAALGQGCQLRGLLSVISAFRSRAVSSAIRAHTDRYIKLLRSSAVES